MRDAHEGRLRGVGMATIVDPSGTNLGYVAIATPAEQRVAGREKSGSTEHVRVSVDAGGEVTVMLGSTPQGQGHRTVIREVVAERLGLTSDHVHAVVEMDTQTTPWTVSSGSYSSRFAPLTTSAADDGRRPGGRDAQARGRGDARVRRRRARAARGDSCR